MSGIHIFNYSDAQLVIAYFCIILHLMECQVHFRILDAGALVTEHSVALKLFEITSVLSVLFKRRTTITGLNISLGLFLKFNYLFSYTFTSAAYSSDKLT